MKTVINEPHVRVVSGPDPTSSEVAVLEPGTMVEAGMAQKAGEESWVAVKLDDGRVGFINGKTRIIKVKQATLLQPEVTASVQPSLGAPAAKTYHKGDQLYLLGSVKSPDGATSWVRVRDQSGAEGYIDGKTRIRTQTAAASGQGSKAAGKRNMMWGAIWCVGGVIATCVGYSMASGGGGGTYLIFWGAIIFGAIQFIRGLIQYTRSPA